MAYAYNYTPAQAGQVVDCTVNIKTSFGAEESIEFGAPLMRGTDPEKQAKDYVSNVGFTTKFLGISVYDPTKIGGNYSIGDDIAVLEQGRIWVPISGALTITAGDYAYLNQDTNVITNASSSHQIIIGTFLSSGVSDGSKLFKLEVVPGFQI